MSEEIKMTWDEFEDKYGLTKNEYGSIYFDFDDPDVAKNQEKHGKKAYPYPELAKRLLAYPLYFIFESDFASYCIVSHYFVPSVSFSNLVLRSILKSFKSSRVLL